MNLLARLLIIVVALAPLGLARQAEQPSLFERVARLMLRRYHDEEFRERTLPGLIERYRERAEAARSDREARAVIFEMLAECPTSHLTILSEAGARHAMNEMTGRTALTLGFQLGAVDGSYFAMRILSGGAAERAGLRRGDRVTHIDRVPTAKSPRFDSRSDDAHLPDKPKHLVLVDPEEPETVRLRVERRPGEAREIEITSSLYSALKSDRASMRAISRKGFRIGYLHLSYMYHRESSGLVMEAIEGPLRGCEGMLLDLRGRGGSPIAMMSLISALGGPEPVYAGPLVLLVDRDTRSAKEALAYELQRRGRARVVGERTAGAVRPGRFVALGHDSFLLLPVPSRFAFTEALELKGVVPDHVVEAPLPYAAGADPILDAAIEDLVSRLPF